MYLVFRTEDENRTGGQVEGPRVNFILAKIGFCSPLLTTRPAQPNGFTAHNEVTGRRFVRPGVGRVAAPLLTRADIDATTPPPRTAGGDRNSSHKRQVATTPKRRRRRGRPTAPLFLSAPFQSGETNKTKKVSRCQSTSDTTPPPVRLSFSCSLSGVAQ